MKATPPQYFDSPGGTEFRFLLTDGAYNQRWLISYAPTFKMALAEAREKAMRAGYRFPYDFVKCEGYALK